MSDWDDNDDDNIDDDDDNGIEEFDPAKSVKESKDIFREMDTICKRKFMDLHFEKFPDERLEKEKVFDLYHFTGDISRIEWYIKHIIRHYYDSDLAFEDDLESVDSDNFPSDKEIKRYLIANSWSYDFITIDRYLNTQPEGKEKEEKLPEFLEGFKILKSLVFEYYPQLENLPARGFRELDRSLYTINYLQWIDLYEAIDKILGQNLEFYEEINRKRKELSDIRDANRKKNNDNWLEKWEKMTDEEKDELDRIQNENERLEEIEYKMRERLLSDLSHVFRKHNPEFIIPIETFMAKANKYCWPIFKDGFYLIHEVIEHYQTLDTPMCPEEEKNPYPDIIEYLWDVYKRMKDNGGDGIENFLNSIEDNERKLMEMFICCDEMTKASLKIAYEFFPQIVDLPASGILDVKHYMDYVVKEAHANMEEVCERLLNLDPEYYEKRDTEIEEYRRKKFKEGEY